MRLSGYQAIRLSGFWATRLSGFFLPREGLQVKKFQRRVLDRNVFQSQLPTHRANERAAVETISYIWPLQFGGRVRFFSGRHTTELASY